MALLEANESMNNDDLKGMVDSLSMIHDNLCDLASKADQSIAHADQTNQASNALFVLREERELISQDDMMDYFINHPYCHFIDSDQNANPNGAIVDKSLE